ncbi:MAG: radical SAM protein, partial [Spirochaetes bacterium]|nr:radical SAM protein [Spirochaetota bacterium]
MNEDKHPAGYENCLLCPRACGSSRVAGKRGFCKESAELRLACAVLYRGEEPPLVGNLGSGAIFVSGCNLGCAFCQTYQASQGEFPASVPLGRAVSRQTLAEICLALEKAGAANINFVTPSHHTPAIIAGLAAARAAGLALPVVWNTSAYESSGSLDLLKGHVSIFMPDLKTLDSALAAKLFRAPDYPDIAKAAILKMIAMSDGRPGNVIIRHLVLPGHLEATRNVLRWFARYAKGRAQLSLMSQYTPVLTPGRERLSKKAPADNLDAAGHAAVLDWLA